MQHARARAWDDFQPNDDQADDADGLDHLNGYGMLSGTVSVLHEGSSRTYRGPHPDFEGKGVKGVPGVVVWLEAQQDDPVQQEDPLRFEATTSEGLLAGAYDLRAPAGSYRCGVGEFEAPDPCIVPKDSSRTYSFFLDQATNPTKLIGFARGNSGCAESSGICIAVNPEDQDPYKEYCGNTGSEGEWGACFFTGFACCIPPAQDVPN